MRATIAGCSCFLISRRIPLRRGLRKISLLYRTASKACGSGKVGNTASNPSKMTSKVDFSVVVNRGTIVVEGAVYYRIFSTHLACFRSHSAFTSCEIVETTQKEATNNKRIPIEESYNKQALV